MQFIYSFREIGKIQLIVIFCLLVTFIIVYLKSLSSILGINNYLLYNIYGFSSWLFPIFILYAIKEEDLLQALYIWKKQIKIGIMISLIFLFIQYSTEINFRRYPTIFLYAIGGFFLIYYSYGIPNGKIIILLGIIVAFLISFAINKREDMLYLVLVLSGILFFPFSKHSRRYYIIWTLILLFVATFLISPNLLFQSSYNLLPKKSYPSLDDFKENLLKDSRSVLVQDFFRDMQQDLIFGRGMEGKYSTPKFAPKYNEEFGGRDTIENGFLLIILKGGIILLITYALVILTSVYLAFFRSSNRFTKILAFLIVCHLIVMYWARPPAADANSMFLWLLVGFCFSKGIRQMNDEHIEYILGHV